MKTKKIDRILGSIGKQLIFARKVMFRGLDGLLQGHDLAQTRSYETLLCSHSSHQSIHTPRELRLGIAIAEGL